MPRLECTRKAGWRAFEFEETSAPIHFTSFKNSRARTRLTSPQARTVSCGGFLTGNDAVRYPDAFPAGPIGSMTGAPSCLPSYPFAWRGGPARVIRWSNFSRPDVAESHRPFAPEKLAARCAWTTFSRLRPNRHSARRADNQRALTARVGRPVAITRR